jgi:hypothetical protein
LPCDFSLRCAIRANEHESIADAALLKLDAAGAGTYHREHLQASPVPDTQLTRIKAEVVK